MKNLVRTLAPLALIATWPAAHSQEMARVVSSTPIVQQVTVPRQVCSETQILVQQPRSGAGVVVGALAGGILGNQIGDGSGRAVATAIGAVGGAILGDQLEGEPGPVARTANSCTQQITFENRVVGYNVVYEYAGRQYTTQMNSDPGSQISIQVTPATTDMQVYTTPSPPPPVIVQAPPQGRIYPPVVVAPAYRPPVYYNPPVYGLPSVNFRWGHGGHNHGPGRGHRRNDDGFPGRWR
jgi:uncharacterized protein YcfJ